jgi:sugar lactone lactonase YvrE
MVCKAVEEYDSRVMPILSGRRLTQPYPTGVLQMSYENSTRKQSFLSQAVRAMKSIKAGTAVLAVLAACASYPALAQDDGETVIVSTLAGSGKQGFADGKGSAARFSYLGGIAVDAEGNLYVTDNSRIRKITPEGEVSTFAGGECCYYDRGRINPARFTDPIDIAIDATGNLYVLDQWKPKIRKVTPEGKVSIFVDDGFNDPNRIAIDAEGNLYVSEGGRIRKITPEKKFSTFVSANYGIAAIAIDAAGNLYVSDYDNHRIRKVTPDGKASTLAGSGKEGFVDGKGSAARFNYPAGNAIDAVGNLYVPDNGRIRKITPEGNVTTLAGNVKNHGSIAIDAEGNLYVVDTQNPRIRKIVIQRP